jgi:hypothetical protein
MLSAVSKAINKSLLDKLPTAVSEKFSVDRENFREFFSEFLTTELTTKKTKKGKRVRDETKTPRLSGYILFSNSMRNDVKQENPDMKFVDIGKELGKRWKDLSQEDRDEWNSKAKNSSGVQLVPVQTVPVQTVPVQTTVQKSASKTKTSKTKETNQQKSVPKTTKSQKKTKSEE